MAMEAIALDVGPRAMQTPREEPLPIGATPPHLRRRYSRIALVSHPRHVAHLDAGDEQTLIVSSDWLLWQALASAKRHCVFLERGQLAAHDPAALSEDMALRANDWAYLDGRDVTEFGGVSLGRQFTTEMIFFIATYYRVTTALTALIEEFGPAEVILFDIWLSDTQATDSWARRQLVVDAVARHGLVLVDRLDPLDLADRTMGNEEGTYSGKLHSRRLHELAAGLYEVAVDRISRLGSVLRRARRGRRVLVLLSWNLVRPLISAAPADVEPVFLARSLPKTLAQVKDWLRRGVLLAGLPAARLSAEEKRQVSGIAQRLISAWSSSPARTDLEFVMRSYVRERVLAGPRLNGMALQVKRAARLLHRYAPERIVLDGLKNAPLSIYLELAVQHGIPVDYIWHSPWAPQNLRFDALGCDPRLGAQVTRCLSWGIVNDRWLQTIGSPVQSVRVGNPLLGKYDRTLGKAVPSVKRGTALVVQYATIFSDLRGLLSHQFYFFISSVRALNDLGFKRVIFKIHPGIVRGEEIFAAVAERYGLRCEIRRFGRFEDLVKTADVVVGPLVSGSALEVAASGTKFLAVLLDPTTLDKRYYGDRVGFIGALEQLPQALEQGRFIDSGHLLDMFCDAEAIPDPVDRFWQALRPEAAAP